MTHRRPQLTFLLAAVVVAAQCLAAEPSSRTYAVLSLVGDRFMVAAPKIDAGRESSRKAFVEFPAGAVDTEVSIAVEDALREADPSSATVLLRARGTEFFQLQADGLDRGGDSMDLYRQLRPRLGDIPATHLILVGKIRREPDIVPTYTCFGSGREPCRALQPGRIEGVGVYVGRRLPVRDANTGEPSPGFLAPFAYVRVSLFDLRSAELITEQVLTESWVFPSGYDKDPMEVLDAAAKRVKMRELLVSAARSAVPRLLQKR